MTLAERYDVFLLDLDGTLYRGEQAIPNAAETVHQLHTRGKKVVFLTNNSGRTPAQIADKLAGFGIEASQSEVVSSALATADVLAASEVGTVYPVCGDGLLEAMRQCGLQIADGEPDRVDAVVVGWDRTADYDKLKRAGLLVQRGARLVASNADAAFPAPDGLWPGAGALLSVITTTTGAVPEIVGKPNPPLFEMALRRAGGGRPLVVGDRLDTDIAGAVAVGWDSLLVLTGVATELDVRRSKCPPTFLAADISALYADPEPERLPAQP